MESYITPKHFDLITPDGYIEKISYTNEKQATATILIKNISPAFLGFSLNKENVFFNLKSTLAQLGINTKTIDFDLNYKKKEAEVSVSICAKGKIAEKLLKLLTKKTFFGKLFAKDQDRKVRDPNYLMRMFGRTDRNGYPLLSLGGPKGRDDLILEKIKGYTVAFLPLKKGVIKYDKTIDCFLYTLAKMLKCQKFKIRELLEIHQIFREDIPRIPEENEILILKTTPLHVRTVFAKVATHLLPQGFYHASACVLQPDTFASGNIYELYGSSKEEITDIPLEFYTLEAHREYVFFEDRDQLQSSLEKKEILFEAFEKAPKPEKLLTSVFVVKGSQLKTLKEKDWIKKEVYKHEFPGLNHPSRQALLVEKYIKEQPSYPFLEAIENDLITSQGILLSRFFPSPLMKKMLISTNIQRCLKGIYFQKPSRSYDIYFSHEDRAFLLDLAKFAIPVYWLDEMSSKILKFVVRPDKDAGMFVPLNLVETFRKACFFGVYGSNLIEGNFEKELKNLLNGILDIQKEVTHPLLSKNTPLALVTGGGPGVMKIGNKVAKDLNILSCANIVDFRLKNKSVLNEQKINPYIDAKMTYRLDKLVERQAEFHLDFPICLQGGIGMDFEFTLEMVKRKVGAIPPTPMLLLGDPSYWKKKLTTRFQCNMETGTIKGSEWVSNCFYCIQKAEEGLDIYKKFFSNTLPIGKDGPIYKEGFCAS
jgi:predicted Rossmann-fold nucleotide-binding protein